ncbi:hypothetical protein BURMUCF2_A1652 [Burkholderia multivorans CF2]|nr:hypothetical protein BURMUCF2_A1652 [Burkholderia multivorans CF2]
MKSGGIVFRGIREYRLSGKLRQGLISRKSARRPAATGFSGRFWPPAEQVARPLRRRTVPYAAAPQLYGN